MSTSVHLAKWVMKRRQTFPVFEATTVGERREVFNHRIFVEGSTAERERIMRKSSESKYADEFNFHFDKYFGFDLKPQLTGKVVLDLGCFTGGRTAAWFERYKLRHVSGVDVDSIYIAAARSFAEHKQFDADYRVGFGENIPYSDRTFDAILTFDVLEHVVDVEATINECHRVLKQNGKMFLVFPTYYQPMEHHLGLVSTVPGLQLLFSGKTLVKAYHELIEERGPDAEWYKRSSAELDKHEVGNTINGTSFHRFRKLVRDDCWEVKFISRRPIGSIGRSLSSGGFVAKLSSLLVPLTYVPFIQDIFLHRVTMVLKKK